MAGGGAQPHPVWLGPACCDLSPAWPKTVMPRTSANPLKLVVKMTGEQCAVHRLVIVDARKYVKFNFCWGSTPAELTVLSHSPFGPRHLAVARESHAVNAYHFDH